VGSIAVIVKELDPFQPSDRFEKAGREAEQQMAFYLRRAFKDDEKVRVFNCLRFIRDGEVAQIDHLILHKFGMVIVESKSVTTEVRVGKDGAWSRVFKGVEHGMKSPVIQAKMQADLLGKLLEDHCAELLNKILGLQAHFGGMPIDVMVAISDSGVLKRSAGAAPEASKADQIPDRVIDLMARYRKTHSIFNPSLDVAYSLNDKELERIAAFLLVQHAPLQRSSSVDIPADDAQQDGPAVHTAAAKTEPATALTAPQHPADGACRPSCPKCKGTNLKLEYRFNFFLRCSDCRAATPLVLRCGRCGTDHKDIQKPATFKDRGVWSIKCTKCGQAVPVEIVRVGLPSGSPI
jgi:hypothetical protein